MTKLKKVNIVFEDPSTGERLMVRQFEIDELLGGCDEDISLFKMTDELVTMLEAEEENARLMEMNPKF